MKKVLKLLFSTTMIVFFCLQLSVFVFSVSEADNNNTIQDAEEILVNTSVTGDLTIWEEDYYVFFLENHGYINLSLSHDYSSVSNAGIKIEVLDENQVVLLSNSFSGASLVEEKTLCLGLSAGTYYLKISNASNWSSEQFIGAYHFVLNYCASSLWEKEKNDSIVSANDVDVNNTFYGTLSLVDWDSDFYRFTLPNAGYINILLKHDYCDTYNAGIKIEVLDITSTVYLSESFSGNSLIEGKTTNLGLDAGTYFLKISNNSTWSSEQFAGNYNFNIRFNNTDYWEKEKNNSVVTATKVSCNCEYHGTLTTLDWDTDYYLFEVLSPRKVSVALSHDYNDTYNAYIKISILNYAQEELLVASSSGSTLTELETSTILLSSGHYFLRVENGSTWSSEQFVGDYRFTIISRLLFDDVPDSAYYSSAVDWAVEQGITSGTSATTFSPNADCTRAQVVTFLWRAAGSPNPKSSYNPFNDVKSGSYYYKAVLWAVENKITAGTSANTFSPNASCTRAQVVTFLWRYEGNPSPSSYSNPFKDVKTGSYYYTAVLWAVGKKVTSGTSATTFSPDATCTRAQVVTFLYRDIVK